MSFSMLSIPKKRTRDKPVRSVFGKVKSSKKHRVALTTSILSSNSLEKPQTKFAKLSSVQPPFHKHTNRIEVPNDQPPHQPFRHTSIPTHVVAPHQNEKRPHISAPTNDKDYPAINSGVNMLHHVGYSKLREFLLHHRTDNPKQQPLCILSAPPGAGMTHLAIGASSSLGLEPVVINTVQMSSKEDIVDTLTGTGCNGVSRVVIMDISDCIYRSVTKQLVRLIPNRAGRRRGCKPALKTNPIIIITEFPYGQKLSPLRNLGRVYVKCVFPSLPAVSNMCLKLAKARGVSINRKQICALYQFRNLSKIASYINNVEIGYADAEYIGHMNRWGTKNLWALYSKVFSGSMELEDHIDAVNHLDKHGEYSHDFMSVLYTNLPRCADTIHDMSALMDTLCENDIYSHRSRHNTWKTQYEVHSVFKDQYTRQNPRLARTLHIDMKEHPALHVHLKRPDLIRMGLSSNSKMEQLIYLVVDMFRRYRRMQLTQEPVNAQDPVTIGSDLSVPGIPTDYDIRAQIISAIVPFAGVTPIDLVASDQRANSYRATLINMFLSFDMSKHIH
jgi:hypothetical protein